MEGRTMAFRIVNTKDGLTGPIGIRYVHDAARPFAVLFTNQRLGREQCVLRCPTEAAAEAAMARFIAARDRYAARQVA
jgi:hypothetical protein